jgi:hypothetical protein
MGTRPQTLYGLADSPVGLAAWLLDHGDGWGQPAPPVTSAVLGYTSHGHPAGDLTRDDVLDNITLYWLTSTAVSSARLYWENKHILYNDADVSVPAAVSVFPGENYQTPRSWAERAYHNLIIVSQSLVRARQRRAAAAFTEADAGLQGCLVRRSACHAVHYLAAALAHREGNRADGREVFRQARQQLWPDRRHGARLPAVSGVLGTQARCGRRRVRTFYYPDADLMPGAEHGDRSLSRCDAPGHQRPRSCKGPLT